MKREFKFRHADEIAGTFVIMAVVLFVLGVVMAGRAQGWFEGKFALNIVFKTAEGSFGLQEGAIVQVRNTVAGRVGKIVPLPGGLMGTTLVLKEGFHPFVTADSVAKVKKKFGVAGDSFIDIALGTGPIIADGASIECVKDEELMETAQKVLAELQATLLPMFEEVQKIVASVASILGSVERGEGIVGAVVSDSELRDDLTGVVAHLEGIAAEAERAVAEVGTLLTNQVQAIVGDVTVMSDHTRMLLTNDVTRIAADMHGIQKELEGTLAETRRLIMGIQRHWLFRKYVKQDSDTIPLVPSALCAAASPEVAEDLRKVLDEARAADDALAIASTAYNLAVNRLASGDRAGADRLNTEARVAYRTAGVEAASPDLLEAELARLVRDFDGAIALVSKAMASLDGDRSKETEAEARILLATIHVDAGNLGAAAEALAQAERLNKRLALPQYAAAILGLRASMALNSGDQAAAAEAFGQQAEQLREAGALGSMVTALRQAGDVYSNLGMSASAAEFYYRAGSSLVAQQEGARAAEVLARAYRAAEAAGDALLVKRIRQLQQRAP